MNTNYQKLTHFEAAAVTLVIAGIILIGVFLFASLTSRQQDGVVTSFNILDIHQPAAQTADTVQFVMDITNEFYNQFYIAFTEVATLPQETFDVPAQIAADFFQGLGSFSDQVATNYQMQNQSPREVAYAGQVLGIAIDNLSQLSIAPAANLRSVPSEACGEVHESKTQTLQMPYSFVPLDLRSMEFEIFNLLINKK